MMRGRRAAALALSAAIVATGGAGAAVAVDRSPATGVVAAAALRPSAVPSPSPSPLQPPPAVVVDGAAVPAAGLTTVAAALEAAGVTPRPGRYVAVVSHQLLGPDGAEPRITVDGRPARLTTPVLPGQRVVTRAGRNETEPTERVVVPIQPVVPTALYVGGRPGRLRIVRGVYSHQVVSRQVLRRSQVGHLVRPGAVALTFDDGPNPPWTGRILRLLYHHHVHATFCLVGQQAAVHRRLVRRIARAGHALCDHTWDHDLDLRARPKPQIALDIRRAATAISRATHGTRPTFFRAPGGNWSPAMIRFARQQGMAPLTWTVDPRDWARPGVSAILHAVRRELRPGGVILMHDGGGNRQETLQALRILLRRLPHLGYHFVLPRSD